MPSGEKKGITVKIDADLHNQIRQYLEEHNMTMAEFAPFSVAPSKNTSVPCFHLVFNLNP